MQLEQYRQQENLSYDELARRLSLKKSTTYNICKGIGQLSLKNAVLIVKGTDKNITLEDLAEEINE